MNETAILRRPNSRLWLIAGAGGLILLTIALDLPALHTRMVADDFTLVGTLGFNDALRYLHDTFGSGRNEYRPITAFTYAVDRWPWGSEARGYHFTNLALYALTGVLFFVVPYTLTAEPLMALVAAALFILHPVNHSRVAWISARDALVSAAFLLTAVLLRAFYRSWNRRVLQILAIIAAGLSLLSYEGAVAYAVLFMLSFRALLLRPRLVAFSTLIVIVSSVPFCVIDGFAPRFGYSSVLGFCTILAACFIDAVKSVSRTQRLALASVGILLCSYYAVEVRKILAEWNEAGEIAYRIPQFVVHRFPDLPPGTILVFKGVAQMHGRAIVFPTGLHAAIQRHYSARLAVHQHGPDTPAWPTANASGVLGFEYVGGDQVLRETQLTTGATARVAAHE